MLTSGFNFQPACSFMLVFYHNQLTVALKCTVSELEAWDIQTDGRFAALLNTLYRRAQ